MRLVCPNCGAQYEVADDVIPESGRDVQCSNCGHTWFEKREIGEDQGDIEMAIPAHQEPEPSPEPASVEEPSVELSDSPKPSDLDPTVAEILQDEAAREEAARAAERGEPLESQTEMGLDEAAEAQREQESQDRIAKIKGEETNAAAVAAAAAASRKEMLPDIEEINSTLRSSEERGEVVEPEPEVVQERQKRGFRTGFLTVILIILLLVLLYIFADRLVGLVPALEGTLTSYVDLVNNGRLWLNGQVEGLRDAMQSAVDENAQPAADGAETTESN